MSEEANRYVIAYDITGDRRRTRVHNYLMSFGTRVQYSVFLVDLKAARLLRLKAKLATMIAADEDSVLVCRVGPSARLHPKAFEYLGQSGPEPPSTAVIL